MALTNIEIVRLQTGDRIEPYFVSDDEIDAYLEINNDNIKRTVSDVAHAILFYLAANPSVYRERTGEEEVYTTDAFKAYRDALLLRIKYPHLFLSGIMPYAAGIRKSDVAKYKNNLDSILIGEDLPNNSNSERNFIDKLSTDPFTDLLIIRN